MKLLAVLLTSIWLLTGPAHAVDIGMTNPDGTQRVLTPTCIEVMDAFSLIDTWKVKLESRIEQWCDPTAVNPSGRCVATMLMHTAAVENGIGLGLLYQELDCQES